MGVQWGFRSHPLLGRSKSGHFGKAAFSLVDETCQTPLTILPLSGLADKQLTHSIPSLWQCEIECDILASIPAPGGVGLQRSVYTARRVDLDGQGGDAENLHHLLKGFWADSASAFEVTGFEVFQLLVGHAYASLTLLVTACLLFTQEVY